MNDLPHPTAICALVNSPVNPAEDRFGALLDAAVDAIMLIDCQGHITRFNPAAERLFGYLSEEIIGSNVNRLMPMPDRARHDGYLGRYLATAEPRIIGIGREVVAQRRDGSVFPIDLSVGEFRSGGEHGFVGILRDITHRKQQEAEIRTQSEELRLIFDNAPTGIIITDTTGEITNANRACARLLGYSIESLIGRSHFDLLVSDDRDTIRADLPRFAATSEPIVREVRYVTCQGHVLYALLQSGAARDLDNEPQMIVCELVDQSALYAANSEAEQLRSRLTHVSRLGTLGEMVSGIAHEVNQPLTAIANYAYAGRRLLRTGKAGEEDLAVVLDKIGAQAERAGQVIRGLRNLARKHTTSRERLDCNTLILEVIRLIESELRSCDWKLRLELAPRLPAVIGDGVQIQQVVLNLLRNAIEAMNERASGNIIAVTSTAPGEAYVEIKVTDSGSGISTEGEEHLFEPFFTTKTQGMGLGLSICKSIAAAHGGEITYRQAINGGAEFTLRLPTVTD